MSTETQIEITSLANVRVGDTVTMAYHGHEFSGVAWARGEDSGVLWVGPRAIRGSGLGTSLDFVRAVRTLPKVDPLPTETGTIVRATYATGESFGCVRDYSDLWRVLTPSHRFWKPLVEDLIVGWRPAHICVEDPNRGLVRWDDEQ